MCDKFHLFILHFHSCSLTSLIWPQLFKPFKRQFDYLCLLLRWETSVKFVTQTELTQWLKPFGSLNQICSRKLCLKEAVSSRIMKKINKFSHNTSTTDIFPTRLSVGKLHKILLFVSLFKPANKEGHLLAMQMSSEMLLLFSSCETVEEFSS